MKNKILICFLIMLLILGLFMLIVIASHYRNKDKSGNTEIDYNPSKLIEVNNSLFELIVSESGTENVIKITTGELGKKYDYDIYYYGLNSVSIKLGNKITDLKEALLTDQITMEQIIEKAKDDKIKGLVGGDIYRDGGSALFIYETYSILKKHRLSMLEKKLLDNGMLEEVFNIDVYIGPSTMRYPSHASRTP